MRSWFLTVSLNLAIFRSFLLILSGFVGECIAFAILHSCYDPTVTLSVVTYMIGWLRSTLIHSNATLMLIEELSHPIAILSPVNDLKSRRNFQLTTNVDSSANRVRLDRISKPILTILESFGRKISALGRGYRIVTSIGIQQDSKQKGTFDASPFV